MGLSSIAGHEVHVDQEGFMTVYDEWSDELAQKLAANIDLELTERHWEVLRFIRRDFEQQGETPTLRRVSNTGGIPIKELFDLFPKKPAKKMAYIAGLPKPAGCV